MPTFLLMGKPTSSDDQGPTEVFSALERSLAACGGHLRDGYLLDGLETAAIVDVPDEASLLRTLLEVERAGFRLHARPAVPRVEAEPIDRAVRELRQTPEN